ncbi:MAG: ArnT family glycosyltransferase [Candidatus Methylacidiphilales bacterium]
MKRENYFYVKAGFLILLFLIVRIAMQFDGLYGQDAYEYLRYTIEMYSFFANGTLLGDYFWGMGYPFLGCIFNFFVHDGAVALQLVSLAAAFITWIYTDKMIALIYPEEPNYLLTFLFLVLSPIFIFQSFLVMSDMLACSFIIMAIYYFIQFIIQSQNKHCMLGVIFSMLSLQTRYASIVILVSFFVLVFIKLLKSRNYKMILFSVLIGVIISLPHIYIRSNNSLNFLSHNFLTEWNILNLFKSSFVSINGESHSKLINLVYCLYSFFHPQFFAFGCLVFILAFLKKYQFLVGNRFQNIMLISILTYAIFLAGIPFQNKRFLALSFPFVIIVCYPVLKQIISASKWSKSLIMGVLVLQFGFIGYFGKPIYQRSKLEKTIANDLIAFPNKTIYTFDIDLALKGRNVQLDYQNIWYKEYENFDKGALVLLNATQIEKQWIGLNPLINWNKLKVNGNLQVLKSYGDGWNLYEIQ